MCAEHTTPAVDILAICAHPDDAELTCAGLMLNAKRENATIGVLDLTRGEMASRGTAEQRDAEAAEAAKILGLDYRHNLRMPDGRLTDDEKYVLPVVEIIRELKPKILLCPYWEDHHPDHVATSRITQKAWWLAGLEKYGESSAAESKHKAHRPEHVLYYKARYRFPPSLLVDVTDVFEKKMESVLAYQSQLYHASSEEPETYIANKDFIDLWHARHRYFGAQIGVKYAEPYLMRTPVPITNPLHLLGAKGR